MITVVTGLPRSGTSLIMQMLSAGGMPTCTDGLRPPDADNPRGYLEHERIKRLRDDPAWLAAADGLAVKIVVPLVTVIPEGYEYDVLWVRRPLDAVIASQAALLSRQGRPSGNPGLLRTAFAAQNRRAGEALGRRSSVRLLYLEFDEVVADPPGASSCIAAFCRAPLEATDMSAAVDPGLRHHVTAELKDAGRAPNEAFTPPPP